MHNDYGLSVSIFGSLEHGLFSVTIMDRVYNYLALLVIISRRYFPLPSCNHKKISMIIFKLLTLEGLNTIVFSQMYTTI